MLDWRAWWPKKTENNEDKLLAGLKLAEITIRALNDALALSHEKGEDYKTECMLAFAAVTLQHGGELTVGKEYFDIIKTNTDPRLTMEYTEGGDLTFKVVLSTDEEAEALDKPE